MDAVADSSAHASPASDTHSLLTPNGKNVQTLGSSALPVKNAPIVWTDEERGATYEYHSNPLSYSCPFILTQEMCERLAYYGLMPTLKGFLKKTLGIGDSEASAYMGAFQGTMYCTPIVSAMVSDTFFGTFKTIVVFSAFYAVGLVLVLLASVEAISEAWMVHLGLLVFVTVGAGGIKSCVNVFGAQQFHPQLQKAGITSFYTLFYGAINVGSLVGGLTCPQVAYSVSYTAAYLIPLCSFAVALTVFIGGSKRYVKILPKGSPVFSFLKVVSAAVWRRSFEAVKSSRGGPQSDFLVDCCRALVRLQPLCALQIPLIIAYNQMATAFLTQGEKMDNTVFGLRFAPALMQNVDAISVIVGSVVVQKWVYPKLRAADKMPGVLARFLFGNALGALSVMWACMVEVQVQARPLGEVSIFWQAPQFSLIAIAEIFTFSTGYEVAFTYSPDQLKTVASGFNLLYFAAGSYLSSALFLACRAWMPDLDVEDPRTYQDAGYTYYFLVLSAICIAGAVLCVLFRPYFRTLSEFGVPAAERPLQNEASELSSPLAPAKSYDSPAVCRSKMSTGL